MSRSANHFFTGAGSGPANYIEDVFSTYLYTGTNSTQSIVNGIDLSTKGGMCWFKIRDTGTYNHALVDTARGRAYTVGSDITDSQYTSSVGNDLASFNTNGFTVGPVQQFSAYNRSGNSIVNWTFREQPKFFDVVTYSGTSSNQTISHNLGSVPGCIMIKTLNAADDWMVYHRSTTATQYLSLNQTIAAQTLNSFMNNTEPTSTVFTVGTTGGVNNPGTTYVAYLFAHNAGGFGLTGTDNVISCGSYTTGAGGVATVNLGFEPQWVLAKYANSSGDWYIFDGMRGFNLTSDSTLSPNLSAAEATVAGGYYAPNATGFTDGGWFSGGASAQIIYIAIRRGPMKVPTTGTSVFSPQIYTEIVTNPTTLTTSFPTDLHMISRRTGTTTFYVADRLRGSVLANENFLETSSTAAETDYSTSPPLFTSSTGIVITNLFNNISGATDVSYQFRRAPSFFDVVCYTGNGNLAPPPSDFKVSHNLTVRPEMVIIKRRNGTSIWYPAVAISSTQWVNGPTTALGLNRSDPADTPYNFSTLSYASSTTFSPAVVAGNGGGGYSDTTNESAATYVAYLFATCAGVSKVGSYTGTATTKQIDCGFTTGARFILIKRTDSTGDWYVWDSVRGIIAGNDPYLLLNSTAAEVTNTDYIDTYSPGFELSSTAPAAINANGGTYIFLAIA